MMELRGSLVAIVTPFQDGRFDEKAYTDLIEFQIENGTSGIVPCGTTGESATLTHGEHVEVIKACVKAVGGRVPVVAGTGSNSTREAIHLTRSAKESGADAALLITPYYNKPPQEGMYQHYRAVAEAVDIPQVIYNCPGRTGVSVAPDTLARLAELPQVIAVKDATGNLDWTTELRMKTDLIILSGDDTATLPMMTLGAVGVISVTANVVPHDVAEMCRLVDEGDWAGARAVHERLFNLTRLLFIESNPVPVKWAMHLMGKIGPEIRSPLSQLSEKYRGTLAAELARVGAVAELAER